MTTINMDQIEVLKMKNIYHKQKIHSFNGISISSSLDTEEENFCKLEDDKNHKNRNTKVESRKYNKISEIYRTQLEWQRKEEKMGQKKLLER